MKTAIRCNLWMLLFSIAKLIESNLCVFFKPLFNFTHFIKLNGSSGKDISLQVPEYNNYLYQH